MAANDNNDTPNRSLRQVTSYAGRHDDLRQGTPAQLRAASSPNVPFNRARDPLIARQMDDMKKTEAKRREEAGRGSQMVKLHRPIPELKPKSPELQEPVRETFNRAWLQEQRAARFAELKSERIQRQPEGLQRDMQRER